MVVGNFFTLYVLAGRTPAGGISQNTGILGHFGLGRLWHLQKSRGWAENGKMQFPSARGTFWGNIRTPHKFLPESAQFFYISCFGRPDPHWQEIAKYGVLRPFWPRAALGTERNSGRKTEKHKQPH